MNPVYFTVFFPLVLSLLILSLLVKKIQINAC